MALDPDIGESYSKLRTSGPGLEFYGLEADFVVFYDPTEASAGPGWTSKLDLEHAICATQIHGTYTHGENHTDWNAKTYPRKLAIKLWGGGDVNVYESPATYHQGWQKHVWTPSPEYVISLNLFPGKTKYLQLFAKERMGENNGQPEP